MLHIPTRRLFSLSDSDQMGKNVTTREKKKKQCRRPQHTNSKDTDCYMATHEVFRMSSLTFVQPLFSPRGCPCQHLSLNYVTNSGRQHLWNGESTLLHVQWMGVETKLLVPLSTHWTNWRISKFSQ